MPAPDPGQPPAPPAGEGPPPPFAQQQFDQQAAPQPQQSPSTDAVLAQIAAAAGLPEGSLSQGNPMETATEIGRALNAMSEELSSLLQARAVARRSVRSGQVTMIGREDNNPLKFMPSPDQALSAMFGPPRPGFQRGGEAIRAAFADIKRHQYATHAAIQPALARLLDDLAPETIEARIKKSGILQNRRARAWETFVERWDAKAQAHDNGMLDVFMAYFAEAYDDENNR
jgi:type VI secretion system FHA domain protein